jgi:putative transposase
MKGEHERKVCEEARTRGRDRSRPLKSLPFPLKSNKEQIVGVLKEAEAGVPMKDLCRRIGISEATFYHWKAKYGGLEVSETRRLRQLEEENGRLKKIVAQQALDLDALKVVLAKKW